MSLRKVAASNLADFQRLDLRWRWHHNRLEEDKTQSMQNFDDQFDDQLDCCLPTHKLEDRQINSMTLTIKRIEQLDCGENKAIERRIHDKVERISRVGRAGLRDNRNPWSKNSNCQFQNDGAPPTDLPCTRQRVAGARSPPPWEMVSPLICPTLYCPISARFYLIFYPCK